MRMLSILKTRKIGRCQQLSTKKFMIRQIVVDCMNYTSDLDLESFTANTSARSAT